MHRPMEQKTVQKQAHAHTATLHTADTAMQQGNDDILNKGDRVTSIINSENCMLKLILDKFRSKCE